MYTYKDMDEKTSNYSNGILSFLIFHTIIVSCYQYLMLLGHICTQYYMYIHLLQDEVPLK